MNANYVNYLRANSFSENTIKNYTHYVNDALEFIGKPETEITYMDLVNWKNTFNNLSVNSRNFHISAIRNYFAFLCDIGIIRENDNPAKKFKCISIREGDVKQKPYINGKDLRNFVNAANTLRDKAIILLYATTGLRFSELAGISVEDYMNMDGENGREIMIVGKGNKHRRIYIADEVKEAIDSYLRSKPYRVDGCNCLFVSSRGNKMSPNVLNGIIKNIAKRAGFEEWEKMSNHCLRAAFATTKNEQGVPLVDIQRTMGHSKIDTTLIYVKTNQHILNSVYREMAF